MNIDDCRLIELPKIRDNRGNLTFLESNRHIPFEIKRVFYVYDIPSGEDRGAHAHFDLHQFIICLSGSLDVKLDDGTRQRTVHLNRPWIGLHIPPMIWASEGNFDPNTVYVVLASDYYRAESYIRDYDDFLKEVRNRVQ
jgi:dTDP-4-dehydrorhamnose 3,5-epimerase-like enzyme